MLININTRVLMKAATIGQVFKHQFRYFFLHSHLIFTVILEIRHYLSFLNEETKA